MASGRVVHNYFRDYDPSIGRYIQSDPIGLDGGINFYGYVDANPLIYIDPTGEFGLLGAAFWGALDLGLQLWANGGNLNCVNWGSVVTSAALGAIGGGLIGKSFTRKPGKVWSHWAPDRYVRPLTKRARRPNPEYKPWLANYFGGFVNSRKLNGNWVSREFHYLTDPKATLRGRDASGKFPKPLQQLLRIPGWIPGTAATAGAAANASSPECGC